MITQLRSFNTERMDLDEMIALSAFGHSLRAEYEKLQLDAPDWVERQLRTLKLEIKVRVQDQLEKRRKEIESKLNQLKTPSERKTELNKELRQVTAQLSAGV
jgi:hypothetical protein